MYFKKSKILLIFVILLILLAGNTSILSKDAVKLTIAGGGPGSASYLNAGTVAEFVTRYANVEGLIATPQGTGGLLENAFLVCRHEADLGLTSTSFVYQGINAVGAFKDEDPCLNVRVVFAINVAAAQWGTFDKNIKNIADLEGKRVNLGPPGSSALTYGTYVLQAAGLWDKVNKETQTWDEGTRMLQDGLVDAMTTTAEFPYPAFQTAVATPGKNFHMIELGEEIVQELMKITPESVPVTIPANVYGEGIPKEPILSVGYDGVLIAHKDVPEWAIYEITKAMMSEDGRKFFINANPATKYKLSEDYDFPPNFNVLESLGIKLHSGAVRYWKEKGMEIPLSVIPEEYVE